MTKPKSFLQAPANNKLFIYMWSLHENEAIKKDEVYLNTRVPTQVNTRQHKSIRVRHESTRINASTTRVNTKQHESDTS